VRHLRRGAGWIAGGLALGIAAALAASALTPRTYEGAAKVLLRESGGGSSLASRLGGLAAIMPGIPTGGGSEMETEKQILMSRPVVESVVDSLGLQALVDKPAMATDSVFAAVRLNRDLGEPRQYRFTRDGAVYRVSGPGAPATVRPGGVLPLPVGVLVLRPDPLPKEFRVTVRDMRDAGTWVLKHLAADKPAGDVAPLRFGAGDPATAAAVPNALVEQYLKRRTTSDRGVNQHRYEFLVAHTDSIRLALAQAEADLRGYQESSGVVDPQLQGKGEFERAMSLRADMEQIDVERRALQGVLASRGSNLSVTEVASYPTLLKSAAINDLMGRIVELQTKRGQLLGQRTETDVDVRTLDANIAALQGQLLGLCRSYLSGLDRQYAQLQQEMGRYQGILGQLPAEVQESGRRQREVKRLTETLLALQTQLVETRLAAMGEGGDVRLVEPAEPPRLPTSPRPKIYLLAGAFAGLVLGIFAALLRGYLDPRVRSAGDAERAAGVPAVALAPGEPLLLGRAGERRGVLVLPAGRGADAAGVARRIAATGALQGLQVALVELDGPGGTTNSTALLPAASQPRGGDEVAAPEQYAVFREGSGDGAPAGGGVRGGMAELEARFGLVVAALPGLTVPATVALLDPARPVVLVARAGHTRKEELRGTAEGLRRMGISIPGVVIFDDRGRGRRGA
jgi:tyrosine-protein kinase Etk/Wzc